jgi:hypothetical protein
MSDEQLYGKEGIERDSGYAPIPEPAPAKPDEPPLEESINNWAADREQEVAAKPVIDRSYVRTDGEKVGEHYPDHGTVSADRAARDLAENREAEAALAEFERTQQLAAEIDAARGLPQPEAQPAEGWQPEVPQQTEQPQNAPTDGGPDDDVVRVLQQNPRVLAAIQAQRSADVAQVETAINSAAQFAQQNAAVAVAAVLARPELQGVHPSQLPGALQALKISNPTAHAEIERQIANTSAVLQQAAQAQQVQQQRSAAMFQEFAKAHDNAFEKSVAGESPETLRSLRAYAHQMLNEAGLSDQEILHQWNSNPLMRSVHGQQILADAARWRINKAALANKVARPVPQVARPGSSMDRPAAAERDALHLEARFRGPLSVKDAAALTIARRARAR